MKRDKISRFVGVLWLSREVSCDCPVRCPVQDSLEVQCFCGLGGGCLVDCPVGYQEIFATVLLTVLLAVLVSCERVQLVSCACLSPRRGEDNRTARANRTEIWIYKPIGCPVGCPALRVCVMDGGSDYEMR